MGGMSKGDEKTTKERIEEERKKILKGGKK